MSRWRSWLVAVSLVGCLAAVSGLATGTSGGSLVDAVSAALPVPAERQLLPRYALWVITVVGLGYVSYVRARGLRRGPVRQLLLRFGTAAGVLRHEFLRAVLRVVGLALLIAALSSLGASWGGAREFGDLSAALAGVAAWLGEAFAAALVLFAVGWRYPRGIVGLVAALLFVPLGALRLEPGMHLALFGAMALLAVVAAVVTTRTRDWTER